ncbi:hypothetical protein PG988_015265 [Apiospora saccharicola]
MAILTNYPRQSTRASSPINPTHTSKLKRQEFTGIPAFCDQHEMEHPCFEERPGEDPKEYIVDVTLYAMEKYTGGRSNLKGPQEEVNYPVLA